jgi:hypothetical protein
VQERGQAAICEREARAARRKRSARCGIVAAIDVWTVEACVAHDGA